MNYTWSRYDDHYFIEVDRDTENPARVLAACQRYAAYYASGAEQRACGVFPLVLWVVPSATRRQQLRRVIASDQRLPAALFAVITNQQIGETIRNGAVST